MQRLTGIGHEMTPDAKVADHQSFAAAPVEVESRPVGRILGRARADCLDQVRRWRNELRPRGPAPQGSGQAN